jgi:5'-3' exonuclease, N-terminal resolvase-like domain
MISEKLFIIDVSNLFWRNMFSLISDMKKNKALWDSLPKPFAISTLEMSKRALLGYFVEEVIEAMAKHLNGHVIILAQDPPDRSWRYAIPLINGGYKGHRVAVKKKLGETIDMEDAKMLIDWVADEIASSGFAFTLRYPRAEADDVVGSLILSSSSDKHVIVSSDTDFLQLAHKANMISPHAENRDCYGYQTESWAKCYLHKKVWRGDPGDNISSVVYRVTGEKTVDKVFDGCEDPEAVSSQYMKTLSEKYVGVANDFRRNKMLIDLSMCPKPIADGIVREYSAKMVSYSKNFAGLAALARKHGLWHVCSKIDAMAGRLKHL